MKKFNKTAKLIKAYRLNSPYSQTELAPLLGYKNGQFVSNVERGLCSVPVKKHKKLSKLLAIPLKEIANAHFEDFRENYRVALDGQKQ